MGRGWWVDRGWVGRGWWGSRGGWVGGGWDITVLGVRVKGA